MSALWAYCVLQTLSIPRTLASFVSQFKSLKGHYSSPLRLVQIFITDLVAEGEKVKRRVLFRNSRSSKTLSTH